MCLLFEIHQIEYIQDYLPEGKCQGVLPQKVHSLLEGAVKKQVNTENGLTWKIRQSLLKQVSCEREQTFQTEFYRNLILLHFFSLDSIQDDGKDEENLFIR